jgi:DNA polymerase III epsilon subunit-like protein
MQLTKDMLEQDWQTFEYSIVDIEGTGAQHRENEGIVDIAAVIVRKGRVTDQRYHQLLDPGIEIPAFISRIHGIYSKDVIGRPKLDDIKSDLEHFLGERFLVAHNAAVERRVLNLKLPNYRPALILDTLKMARALYGASYGQGLDDLIDRLSLQDQLPQEGGAMKRHGALYDAKATAHAFVQMARENFPGGCPVRDLAAMCALNWDPSSNETESDRPGPKRQSSFGW